MKVTSISPRTLRRKFYSSADALAAEIAEFIFSSGRTVSLATDFRWWAKQLVDPHAGLVTNVSLGYEGDFLEPELIEALKKRNLLVMPFPGQSWFYTVRRSLL